jgi:Bacterial Ig-like domain (group 3)/FG-GAP-like repeat/FG-GAP repeat
VTGETASYTDVIASGDFNGDGSPDVLAIDFKPLWDGTVQEHDPYPNIVLGMNDGKGNFTYTLIADHETLYGMNANDIDGGLVQPIAVDFNGDKYPDVLLYDQTGGMWIAWSKADGTYAAPAKVTMTPANQCAFSRADAGDLNGDGKLDLVLAYPGDSACSGGTTPSGVYSLLSNGDGTFTTSFTAVGTSAYQPKLIDFDGDGKLDLALSDANFDEFTFGLEIVPGNGDGTFNAAAITHPLGAQTAVSAIIPGDFNGDGKQDLIVGVEFRFSGPYQILGGTTGVAMFPGNGDFSFGYSHDYFFQAFPNDGKFADFNGDGRPDLALNVGFLPFAAAPVLSNFGYMVNLGDGNFSTFQPSVTGVYDTGGFLGAGDFNATGTLSIGDFNHDGGIDVMSTLPYDDEYHYSSQLYFNAGAMGLSLTSSAATADQDTPVVLTAALSPSVSSKTPSGSVSFYDNGTLLQTIDVNGTSVSATLSGLAVGANAITASYSGDGNFNAATASTGVNVAITALSPNFTLALPTPATLSLAQGATGTATILLTGNATFSGAVTLACSGAPTEATCSVSPGTITLAAGQSALASVVVATTAKNNTFSAHNAVDGFVQVAGGTVFAAGLLFFWPGSRRKRITRVWVLTLVFAGTAATFSMTGCGGSGNKYPGTPVGNATLTVTATSGSIKQSQTFTLTITQSN